MKLSTYLFFNGQCAAAFEFYEKCLGGETLEIQTFGDSPHAEDVSPENRDLVINACLTVGDQVLMGSDAPPELYNAPQGFSVSVQVDDVAEAERLFRALSEGGEVFKPLEKTFWAERFGMLVDPFGISWMVNCPA